MSTDDMREMAEFLRSGARMLNQVCPECGTPLFQDGSGRIFCPRCKRPVKFVEGERRREVPEGSLEMTLSQKLSHVQTLLDKEEDPARIRELTDTISSILNALERARRLE